MPFVIDPSFAAAWFLPDERNPAADALLKRLESDLSEHAVVPTLFRHELLNLLWTAHRRGRIDEDAAFDLARRAERYPFRESAPSPAQTVLRLARDHRLTTSDAAYLALARDNRFALASNDKDLVAAARKEGVNTITAQS
jgi:predicted nucleic acid-binding protein